MRRARPSFKRPQQTSFGGTPYRIASTRLGNTPRRQLMPVVSLPVCPVSLSPSPCVLSLSLSLSLCSLSLFSARALSLALLSTISLPLFVPCLSHKPLCPVSLSPSPPPLQPTPREGATSITCPSLLSQALPCRLCPGPPRCSGIPSTPPRYLIPMCVCVCVCLCLCLCL
jgi:hypothetical protein